MSPPIVLLWYNYGYYGLPLRNIPDDLRLRFFNSNWCR